LRWLVRVPWLILLIPGNIGQHPCDDMKCWQGNGNGQPKLEPKPDPRPPPTPVPPPVPNPGPAQPDQPEASPAPKPEPQPAADGAGALQPPGGNEKPPRGKKPKAKEPDSLESGKQDKLLSKGEVDALKKMGVDIHDLKGKKNASQRDLYKTADGEIVVKPKGGAGPGEPTGYNIKDLAP
jgi:hypothetical protein